MVFSRRHSGLPRPVAAPAPSTQGHPLVNLPSPSLSSSSRKKKKPWQRRISVPFASKSSTAESSQEPLSTLGLSRTGASATKSRRELTTTTSRTSARSHRKKRWWKIRLFRGMWNDVRRRIPYFLSDWTDAWDYRVVPATVYMYFANILPALAFSLDMFSKTNMSYGVNEVLLASVLGSVVFSVFAAQPLTIVGVTGPITVFNYTVYDIMTPRGTNYFAFMCWIGLWSLVMHWILAITNSCNGLRYVTRFSCDTFGFYVACIYLQKGIQVLTRQWAPGDTSAYLSIMVALLVLIVAYICGIIGASPLFQMYIRKFIEDYGTPLTIVFFTGFVHIGKMRSVHLETLPTSKAFFPTTDRGWFIHFWDIDVGDVFIAIPFAILLTILFYFDHNVSSLMAQGTEFPLKKPAGFHWDLFLLGLTTGVAGLLGVPFPNGLIPQAPFHTNALCATRLVSDDIDESHKGKTYRVVDHVVEQRVSNLAQGLLTLGTMTGPLLIVVHLIPQGVLAGLFFVMGVQALEANGITKKLVFICRDAAHTPASDPFKRLSTYRLPWRRRAANPHSDPGSSSHPPTGLASHRHHRKHSSSSPASSYLSQFTSRFTAVHVFTVVQLLGFGATFAISQTIAAIGFPIIVLLLIPLRSFVLPYPQCKYGLFTNDELAVLDAPTASPFTMESVGGNYGEDDDDDDGMGEEEEETTPESQDLYEPARESSNTGTGGTGTGTGTPLEESDGLERGEMRHPLPFPPSSYPREAEAEAEAAAAGTARTARSAAPKEAKETRRHPFAAAHVLDDSGAGTDTGTGTSSNNDYNNNGGRNGGGWGGDNGEEGIELTDQPPPAAAAAHPAGPATAATTSVRRRSSTRSRRNDTGDTHTPNEQG
ncbi:hypothetical protein L228DRAFT_90514 [Xylona heveae TC161]|uniref:Bicarbonate transporter-like transmembrane domain-containing protein n=1 Tax=Xylona heveae (strain CBS 132557 / TC161) TaxID=1328760 RepID=A0A165HZU6_XYLHT|nr:hypothetical protein L228DRAFT_90514 [Xylona heveae TC161]KZF24152.1 hypothetical protein L228DRAFT_90514 [Xylona heveae TC161]